MRFGCRSFFLSVAALFATSASAGTLVPVTEVPGSVPHSTIPVGISDNGVVAGSYMGADLSLHGFTGKPDGKKPYFLFDAGAGTNGTQPRAINNQGWVTGYWNANSCDSVTDCFEFEMSPIGDLEPIKMNGNFMTGIVQGINSSGVFVGDYHPPTAPFPDQSNGYSGFQNQYTADITLPFATRHTRPRGINNAGTVVGFFNTPGDISHGFVLQSGNVTVIDFPDPTQTGTFPEGINDQGWIAGQWTDAAGNSHGFLLNPFLTTFTDVNVPGATSVQVWNINNAGEVTVGSDVGGFIYCMKNNGGRCNNLAKAVAMTTHAVRPAAFRSFACAKGCRSATGSPMALMNAASRQPEKPLLKSSPQKPYVRPQ
jgi:hypothetical protein